MDLRGKSVNWPWNGAAHTRVLALLIGMGVIAVHATNPPAGACIIALDGTAHRAFQIAGSGSVTTACSAAVASNASDGFEMEGAQTLLLQNHSQVGVVGGWQLNGQTSLKDTISNQVVQPFNITLPPDPLAGMPAPTSGTIVSGTHVNYDMNNKPANNTLLPGVYCGGLTIGNTGGVNFTLSAGTYVMAGGGLTINSQAKVTGSGVTIYNTSSSGWGCSGSSAYTPINIDGQANVTMSAPTSGVLGGVLFFGNRTGCATAGTCQNSIQGGATTVFNGALYFKSDLLLFSGNSSSTGYMMLVADIIHINGSATIGTAGNPINGIQVTVTPPTVSLGGGQTQQFSAAVSNTGNGAVTWSISPTTAGSISTSGLYTAPAAVATASTVVVTATSVADPTKSGTASISLSPPAPPITVTVTPATATIAQGGTQQFNAVLANTTNQNVTWTASAGTVSASGLYTAPATVASPLSVTITAKSVADTSKTGTATVTVNPPPITVTVTPATATTNQGVDTAVHGDGGEHDESGGDLEPEPGYWRGDDFGDWLVHAAGDGYDGYAGDGDCDQRGGSDEGEFVGGDGESADFGDGDSGDCNYESGADTTVHGDGGEHDESSRDVESEPGHWRGDDFHDGTLHAAGDSYDGHAGDGDCDQRGGSDEVDIVGSDGESTDLSDRDAPNGDDQPNADPAVCGDASQHD